MVSDRPKITPRRLLPNADNYLKVYNSQVIEEVHTPIPKPRPMSTFAVTQLPPVAKPRNSLLSHKRKQSSSLEDLENGVEVMESNSNSIETIFSEKANIDHRSINNNNDNKTSLGIFPSGSNYNHYSIGMQNVSSKKGGNKSSNLLKIHTSRRKSKSKKTKYDNDPYFLPTCSIL